MGLDRIMAPEQITPGQQYGQLKDAQPLSLRDETETGRIKAAPAHATVRENRRRRRLSSWPLWCVLAVQAGLSVRLMWSDTAYTDEALYLWAGRVEWANVLHGTPIPAFPAYFSGSPVIYPPLGALADLAGGLVAARFLSLAFMLGCTAFLWGTARHLYGRAAAFYAVAIFVALGSVQHLGAFATYDALSLMLMSLSAWCIVRAGRFAQRGELWMFAAAIAIAAANLAKYASALFDPVIFAMAWLMVVSDSRARDARLRVVGIIAMTFSGLFAFIEVTTFRNGELFTGIEQTTLARAVGKARFGVVLGDSWSWTWPVLSLASLALLAAVAAPGVRMRNWGGRLMLCVLALSSVLVPLQQARIHTLVSLEKHVAFGAWFAAIACGWVLAEITHRFGGGPKTRITLACCASAAIILTFIPGAHVASQLTRWANGDSLVSALRPYLTGNNGAALIEDRALAEYYLSTGQQWRHWSTLSSIDLPNGKIESQPVGIYIQEVKLESLVKNNYFSVIELNDVSMQATKQSVTRALAKNRNYRLVASGPYGAGSFDVWVRNAR